MPPQKHNQKARPLTTTNHGGRWSKPHFTGMKAKRLYQERILHCSKLVVQRAKKLGETPRTMLRELRQTPTLLTAAHGRSTYQGGSSDQSWPKQLSRDHWR